MPARSSCSFASSGVSKTTFGTWTKTLGPVRAYGTPLLRASTHTWQVHPGRGVVVAPPEPSISTLMFLSRGHESSCERLWKGCYHVRGDQPGLGRREAGGDAVGDRARRRCER